MRLQLHVDAAKKYYIKLVDAFSGSYKKEVRIVGSHKKSFFQYKHFTHSNLFSFILDLKSGVTKVSTLTGLNKRRLLREKAQAAFTLIELILVVAIIGVLISLLTLRSSSYSFWQEEAFLRKLSETIVFLHHQAIVDQSFYVVKFDFENNQYSIGLVKPEEEDMQALANIAQDAGNLTLELASFLSPAIGRTQTIIPPPSFPSLAEPVSLPPDCVFTDIRTMRGVRRPGDAEGAYILFSPRGFSEFGVIHLRFSQGNRVTILINPFTGLTDIYRTYKDFEWTYDKKKKSKYDDNS